jgi:TetR/AcrR family transcriptional repressor of nem operon
MGQVSNAKEKLLGSALELMYARSYGDVGVQEICEHAGVKKGSFYHFFPSKRDLTLAAIDQQWADTRQHVIKEVLSGTNSPLKRVERCVELFYETQCGVKTRTGHVMGCPFGNLAVELSTQDEHIRRKIDSVFHELAGYLETTLEAAIAAGEVPKQDVHVTAQALVAFIQGIVLLAKSQNDPEVIGRLGKGFVRLITGGTGSLPKPSVRTPSTVAASGRGVHPKR